MLKKIKTQGYFEIDTNISNIDLLNVVKSFREFDKHTSISDKEGTWLNKNDNLRVRLGYKDKTDEGGFDNKCYFHYNPMILEYNNLKENIYYSDFLESINRLYDNLQSYVYEILDNIECKTALKKSDFIDDKGNCNLTLRILNYKPKEYCKTLAKAHTDRNFMTIAVYETDDGLRFYHNNQVNNIQYDSSKMKIFPGNLWSNVTQTQIGPTKHDVIKKEGNRERSSIVLFCLPLE